MNLSQAFLFGAGLGALVLGAELLVRGAARLSAAAGISPLVIGLTVVAFGTSAPELAVSVHSAVTGKPDISLGNAVGSNIFNVLLILGVSAIIKPLEVKSRLIIFDVPVMIGSALLFLVITLNGWSGRPEGVILLLGFCAYTAYTVRAGTRDPGPTPGEAPAALPERNPPRFAASGFFTIAGLLFLVLGSRWLVEGAASIARLIGISELVIALTIVAAGTSLPEAATSIVAAIRGERDIAVGNVIGSNIFNVLAVLGTASAASPGGIPISPAALHFDIPVMLVVSLACLPIFFTGHVISRWEGILFLGYYAAYLVCLILTSSRPAAHPSPGGILLLFVLPLIAITLLAWLTRFREKPGIPGGKVS